MKNFKINEMQLNEICELIKLGYHELIKDNGDCLTVFLTNGNGKMKEKDIDDRFYDLPCVENN